MVRPPAPAETRKTMEATKENKARERYWAMKDRQQKEVNAFPMFAAFSDEQLEEGKKKLGVTENRELCHVGASCFIRKADKASFLAMLARLDRERDEAMKDEAFAVDAFAYELANHEYCITMDPTDALSVFGYTLKSKPDAEGWAVPDWVATFGGNEMLARAFKAAMRKARH